MEHYAISRVPQLQNTCLLADNSHLRCHKRFCVHHTVCGCYNPYRRGLQHYISLSMVSWTLPHLKDKSLDVLDKSLPCSSMEDHIIGYLSSLMVFQSQQGALHKTEASYQEYALTWQRQDLCFYGVHAARAFSWVWHKAKYMNLRHWTLNCNFFPYVIKKQHLFCYQMLNTDFWYSNIYTLLINDMLQWECGRCYRQVL